MEHGPLGALIINLSNISQSVFWPQCKVKQIKGLLWRVFLYWVRRLPSGGGAKAERQKCLTKLNQTALKLQKVSVVIFVVNSNDFCSKCIV